MALCKNPYMIGPLPCPCQRCMPCRVNKKRLWSFRCEMEAGGHKESCVATLTYSDLFLPEGGNLDPVHVQRWLKRFRKVLAPQKIRYYLVGEYGKTFGRPHYHVIIFGVGADRAGGPRTLHGRIAGAVGQTWKYGQVYVDECTPESMAYIAGYVTKKLTKGELDDRGLRREFVRMSLRPGIGASIAKDTARALRSDAGLQFIVRSGDVPYALRNGSKVVPLGRYLRGLLREAVGFGSRECPDKKKAEYWREMFKLRRSASENPQGASSFKEWLIDRDAQKIINLEARSKLFADKPTF